MSTFKMEFWREEGVKREENMRRKRGGREGKRRERTGNKEKKQEEGGRMGRREGKTQRRRVGVFPPPSLPPSSLLTGEASV